VKVEVEVNGVTLCGSTLWFSFLALASVRECDALQWLLEHVVLTSEFGHASYSLLYVASFPVSRTSTLLLDRNADGPVHIV